MMMGLSSNVFHSILETKEDERKIKREFCGSERARMCVCLKKLKIK